MFGKEEIDAALVLILSGALMVQVAWGDGSLSLGRMASRVLSNPIGATSTRDDESVPAPDRQIAA